MKRSGIILFLYCLSCLSFGMRAQDKIPFFYKDTLPEAPFINVRDNCISDSLHTLEPFYEKLKHLRTHENSLKRVVNVLQIGDSHIQGGFLSGQVMHRFQSDFGNAGRGLIVPLKLLRSNEPRDYAIRSGASWVGNRCIDRKVYSCPGIGGMAVATRDTSFSFDIATLSKTDSCNRFKSITVFHEPCADGLWVSTPGIRADYMPTEWNFASRIVLDSSVCNIGLRGKAMLGDTSVYYAMNLESGNPGILYHSSGINGACFSHYGCSDQVLTQTAALTPDLIILSLGTNEAFGACHEEDIYSHIDKVVGLLRSVNPEAVFLLTTPAECHRRIRRRGKKRYYYTYVPNVKVEKVAQIIRKYAVDKGIAYWDLFSVSGGSGSAGSWVKYKLSAYDRVHFSVDGYKLQGNLLYDAIIKGYDGYIGK